MISVTLVSNDNINRIHIYHIINHIQNIQHHQMEDQYLTYEICNH